MGERPGSVDWNNQSESGDEALIISSTEVTIVPDDDDENVGEIRSDIEQTRDHMSETINAIQDRLNPDNLKEQVKEHVAEQVREVKDQVVDQVREVRDNVREATIGKAEDMVRNAGETVNEARYTVWETIKENPVPAALAGLGLGWLFMNRSSGSKRPYQPRYDRRVEYGNRGYSGQDLRYADRSYYGGSNSYSGRDSYGGRDTAYDSRYGSSGMLDRAGNRVGDVAGQVRDTASNVTGQAVDTVSNVASQAVDTVSNVASQAQDTAGHFVDTAQETVSGIYDQATNQAQRLEDRFGRVMRDNPLAVGAVTLALGAAVGLALPTTEKENELMGDARDSLVQKATSAASETFEKVQQVAGQVTDQASQAVKQGAQEQGLTA